jgi:hypothetical protein
MTFDHLIKSFLSSENKKNLRGDDMHNTMAGMRLISTPAEIFLALVKGDIRKGLSMTLADVFAPLLVCTLPIIWLKKKLDKIEENLKDDDRLLIVQTVEALKFVGGWFILLLLLLGNLIWVIGTQPFRKAKLEEVCHDTGS